MVLGMTKSQEMKTLDFLGIVHIPGQECKNKITPPASSRERHLGAVICPGFLDATRFVLTAELPSSRQKKVTMQMGVLLISSGRLSCRKRSHIQSIGGNPLSHVCYSQCWTSYIHWVHMKYIGRPMHPQTLGKTWANFPRKLQNEKGACKCIYSKQNNNFPALWTFIRNRNVCSTVESLGIRSLTGKSSHAKHTKMPFTHWCVNSY